jgi:hypothetical protein
VEVEELLADSWICRGIGDDALRLELLDSADSCSWPVGVCEGDGSFDNLVVRSGSRSVCGCNWVSASVGLRGLIVLLLIQTESAGRADDEMNRVI